MPKGRVYCPLEGEYVPLSEVRTVAGTRIHDVEPAHRLTDGMSVQVVGGVVVVDASAAIIASGDAFHEDRA